MSRPAYDRLVAEVVTTLTLGLGREDDVDTLAADVVHELLEAGTENVEQRARVFLAARDALA